MNDQTLTTVRIADGDDDYLVINERDFDPKRHTLFGEDAPSEEAPEPTLIDINGIGPKTVKKLAAAGIETLEALVAADGAQVIEATGAKPDAVVDWVAQAAALVTEPQA